MTEVPDAEKTECKRARAELSFASAPMITDEDLMRYIDGTLDPARRAIVRLELARDPALVERLEAFLITRGPLTGVFDPVVAAPVPDKLLAPFRARRRFFGLLPSARGDRKAARLRAPLLAAAAVCVLVAGAWIVRQSVYDATGSGRYDFVVLDDQSVIGLPKVQAILEGNLSGVPGTVSERLSVKPLSTLVTPRGTWCREVSLEFSTGPRGRSVACRQANGTWLVPGASAANKPYEVAAGGSQPKSADEILLDSVKQLMGQPVTPAREKALLAGHWREKP